MDGNDDLHIYINGKPNGEYTCSMILSTSPETIC